MQLELQEIIKNAVVFSKRWEGADKERAEAQTFWNEFFSVFGLDRKQIAQFEKAVKKIDNKDGRIDLFWKGKLLAEHKSKGEDLIEAKKQLNEYWVGLNKNERPRYLIVSDFENIAVHDTDTHNKFKIKLDEFAENIHKFSFIYSDYKSNWDDEEKVNIAATELMSDLHDAFKTNGYKGENLEKYLMRILFCLFAEDTGIFQKGLFQTYLIEHTKEDGSDTGSQLNSLFEILNIPENKRQKNISDILKKFEYVNGSLYAENLPIAHFSKKQRDILLKCCGFNWNEISPVIFGSMFQYVVDEKKRTNVGAHYTSEKNILKAVNGLFLDELYNEFEKVKFNKNALREFHSKIEKLKFLDPACGCGNFLIITYRELRLLEIEILKQLHKIDNNQIAFRTFLSFVHLDSFYGIEHEEFPAKVAETAMWLMEHKMNQKMLQEFGENIPTLPLKKTATIIHGNAIRVDWNDIIPKKKLSYIIGNPPFIAKQERNREQNKDIDIVFKNIDSSGNLDYVCAWYVKAAEYIKDTKIKVAFVSTNSITQGEQVGTLWKFLSNENIKIHFAHRTFKWSNEAKGNASVFVVIIGFANYDVKDKFIYEYDTPNSTKPHKEKAKNINLYLIDFDDIVINNITNPISDVPEIIFGSMPNDDGNFLLTDEEKKDLVKINPQIKPFIKPLISAKEYLNGKKRWCIWLKDENPKDWRNIKELKDRVEAVKEYRLKSDRPATKKLAEYPYLFGETRQPKSNYILIPLHSSENRKYIPMGFFTKNDIANNSTSVIPNATLYHFGILTSEMHMTWVRQVCGRIKSDFRYSNKLVYNNFPFPENVSEKIKNDISKKAENILDVREKYKDATLADLYDQDTMPIDLRKAHEELDKAVDLCYGVKFKEESKRLQFLFNLYKQKTTTAELF